MNTLITKRNTSLLGVDQSELDISVETRQLMSLGEYHGWDFRFLGKAPMPDKPIRLGDWLLVPAQEDSTAIPPRAFERIQALFAAGIRPRGFVLVHEAPMLLSDSMSKQTTASAALPQQQLQESFENLISAAVPILSGLASLATALLTFTATALVPATLMMGALLLDPILVAVTEDGYWIEIDRWWRDVGT